MPYRKLSILALVVAVLVTGTATDVRADDVTRRDRMLRLLNQTRRNHGLPVFRINLELSHFAWLHSKRMANADLLFHTSNLYSHVQAYSPSTWGENIGYAGTLRRVRRLWMQSGGHRDNVLARRFRRIGIGVFRAQGVLWVTAIFYGT